MRTKLDANRLEELYSKDISYKEIAQITGYNICSVNSYFWRTKGKMEDTRKYRRNSIPITDIQKEILFGTLLGDGNIQKQKLNSYTGKYNHCLAQEPYAENIRSSLGDLVTPMRYYSRYCSQRDKYYYNCNFTLKNNYNLKYFYGIFYVNKFNKRDVPQDLSLLTPRAMAYLFMDDGTASGGCTINIALCSFSQEGLQRLSDYLLKTYGLNTVINKENKLVFKAESARKFYHLVKEYIVPSMMYKFKYVNKEICVSKIR